MSVRVGLRNCPVRLGGGTERFILNTGSGTGGRFVSINHGTDAAPVTSGGATIKISRTESMKFRKSGTASYSSGVTTITVAWSASYNVLDSTDNGRAISGTNIPAGTTVVSSAAAVGLNQDVTISAATSGAGSSAAITVGDANDAANQFDNENNAVIHAVVYDAPGNQTQISAAVFGARIREATSWDAVAASFIGKADGSATQTASGIYAEGRREVDTAKIIVQETRVANVTSTAEAYDATAAGRNIAHWITASGNANAEAAVKVGTAGRKFQVAFGAVGDSIATALLRDDSNSPTVFDINGSHTDVLDTVGATLSGGALRLARAHYLGWRNNADDADLGNGIGVDTLNRLTLGIGSYANVLFARTLVLNDGVNIVPGSSTGTKLGSSTSQKWAIWNATPIVQPTIAGTTAATFVANSGTAVNDASTFDGWTIAKAFKALRNFGVLA